jgi:hypothetical protein
MRRLILFLIFFITFPIVFAQNETMNETSKYTFDTFGKIHLTYTIVGEITNLNPYSIFVAIPDGQVTIESYKSLPLPSDGIIHANIVESGLIYYHLKPERLTKFNKKEGFWLPPYTTTKLKLRVYDYNLTIYVEAPTEYDYRVIGPAVANTYKVLKIENLFPHASKEHIKLGNFKLYVDGYIEIYKNVGASSVIIPLPLVLDKYKNLYIIKDKTAPDVWINYYDWYHNFINTKNYYLIKELEKEISDFDPMLSYDFNEFEVKKKEYPAMAFTIDEGGGKIEFYYTMEWDGDKELSFPDII